MTYDVTDTCNAWTTAQHLAIQLTNKDGQEINTVSDYATWSRRTGHGSIFTPGNSPMARSARRSTELRRSTPGATHQGRGYADYTAPEKKRLPLPAGTLLPMAHTSALINAAAAGKRFFAAPLFDGTGTDGAQDTFVTVENWKPASEQKWPTLSNQAAGRVHIAFFQRAAVEKDAADETPDYEIGIHYFASGVSDAMTMNFGDFSMDGTLDQFEPKRPPHC